MTWHDIYPRYCLYSLSQNFWTSPSQFYLYSEFGWWQNICSLRFYFRVHLTLYLNIEYIDSFNTVISKQKLQQTLKFWPNVSLVLFPKGQQLREIQHFEENSKWGMTQGRTRQGNDQTLIRSKYLDDLSQHSNCFSWTIASCCFYFSFQIFWVVLSYFIDKKL